MTHENHHHEVHTPGQSEYLSGAQILPTRVRPGMTVAELIDEQFQAYNGARLNEAARLYAEEMLNPEKDVTVGLTMAGALTPAGLGGCILTLMEYGFIDFIVSTGANLYHDMHHALAMSLHRGDFRLDDTKLQEEGVIRIYDILFEDKVLLDTDAFVRESLKSLPNRPISTSELHYHLGTQLLQAGVRPNIRCWLRQPAWNVPIYTSSPGDFSIGMNVARNALDGSKLTLDPLADVNETTAIVLNATRNGVIILGGGSPKNFYLQTQPQLWEVLGINKGGHDYFIQITADAPHWGYSPARPHPKRFPGAKSSPTSCAMPSWSTEILPLPCPCSLPTRSVKPNPVHAANSTPNAKRCSTNCKQPTKPENQCAHKVFVLLCGVFY